MSLENRSLPFLCHDKRTFFSYRQTTVSPLCTDITSELHFKIDVLLGYLRIRAEENYALKLKWNDRRNKISNLLLSSLYAIT